MTKQILFFSPHALIRNHAIPEANISYALKESAGSEVTYIGCEGALGAGCTTHFFAQKLNEDNDSPNRKLCKQCKKSQHRLAVKLGFNRYSLEDFLRQEDYRRIEELLNSTSPLDISLDGIEIGRIASYDVLLHVKEYSESSLFGKHYNLYKSVLKSCLITYYSLANYNKAHYTDVLFLYNTCYSSNRVAMHLAEKSGILTYCLHATNNFSRRLSRLEVYQGVSQQHQAYIKKLWPSIKDKIFLSRESIENTCLYMSTLLDSKLDFTYSPKANKIDPRTFYDIPIEQNVVLVTLSSNDERFAASFSGIPQFTSSASAFSSQLDWISYVIDMSRQLTNIRFVIRPHPRDFPNKRESKLSEFGQKLSNLFDGEDQLVIDWPSNKISAYDWIPFTSLLLYSWSSIAKEFALFGVPTLGFCDSLITYPRSITIIQTSKDLYREVIEKCGSLPLDTTKIIDTFKWYELEHQASSLPIPVFPDEISQNYRNRVTQLAQKIRSYILCLRGRQNDSYYNEIMSANYKSLYSSLSQMIEQEQIAVSASLEVPQMRHVRNYEPLEQQTRVILAMSTLLSRLPDSAHVSSSYSQLQSLVQIELAR
jgi:hypothetical protein